MSTEDIKEAIEIIDTLCDRLRYLTPFSEDNKELVEKATKFTREHRKYTVNTGSFFIIEHQVDEGSPVAIMDPSTSYIMIFDSESQAQEFADANCAWGFNICRLT